ncbi:hypothetical protein F9C11_26825 [Amycolatopsis sp. VS8301801F10]|uniref:hypothetical protein n=1 Tax=Amycolatopsis sp. VS8301801F10 TaxID=2652442 RepID=UPI0038FC1B23
MITSVLAGGWPDFGNVPDWIAALAGVGTLGIAVLAASAAFKQVGEARRLREEQARPFVVVDFEPNGAGHPYMDIVVKNYGATLAKNVRITFEPPLASTLDNIDETPPVSEWALFSEPIPTIPPGKEYRGLFENMPTRFESNLPRRYAVTVGLDGPTGPEALRQILDLGPYFGVKKIDVQGLHHIAKSLRAWAKHAGANRF